MGGRKFIMDIKKFAGAIRKNNRLDAIHSYVILAIILIYALVGTSNVHSDSNSMHLTASFTSGFMIFQMIVLMMAFSLRFVFSYLRVKNYSDGNVLQSVNVGMGYNYVYDVARKGALPGSYLTLIFKKMLVYQLIMVAALLASTVYYKDNSCYILVAAAVIVPVLVWLIIKVCFELRVSTRSTFRILTAPLAVIKMFIGVFECVFTVVFGFTVWVIIFAFISGRVHTDMNDIVAIRSFTNGGGLGLVFMALSFGFGVYLYVMGEAKRIIKWFVLYVVILTCLMGGAIYVEKNNNITVTETEIIRMVDGKKTVISFDQVKEFEYFNVKSTDTDVFIIDLANEKEIDIVADDNMRSDLFIEKYGENGNDKFFEYIAGRLEEAGAFRRIAE